MKKHRSGKEQVEQYLFADHSIAGLQEINNKSTSIQ